MGEDEAASAEEGGEGGLSSTEFLMAIRINAVESWACTGGGGSGGVFSINERRKGEWLGRINKYGGGVAAGANADAQEQGARGREGEHKLSKGTGRGKPPIKGWCYGGTFVVEGKVGVLYV